MFIDHDMHIHTHYSPCADATATAEHYIQKAHELGLKKIGFADHMWGQRCGMHNSGLSKADL